MAARPKQKRFTAAIARIGKREGFEGPEAGLLWVLSEIEAGVPVATLWQTVQAEAGETSTRTWAYTVIAGLAPDARARLREARKVGAAALADEAIEIADRPASTTVDVQSARLQVDTRLRLAGVFDREGFGDSAPKVSVNVNVGNLHLDALRQRCVVPQVQVVRQLEAAPADYEIVEH